MATRCASGLVLVDVGGDNPVCVTPDEAAVIVSEGAGTIVAPSSMGVMDVFGGSPSAPGSINWMVIGLVGLGLILLLKKK